MNANATRCNAANLGNARNITPRLDLFRMRMIRETERYLNDPYAPAWERIRDCQPGRMSPEPMELAAV